MARRKRKAKEQYTGYVWEITAPEEPKPPPWLVDGTIMKVSMVEEAPDEFAPKFRGRKSFWGEIRERLTAAGTPEKIYEYTKMNNVWGDALKYVDVLDLKGAPVAWYDLDGGLVQYTTLWDLLFVGPVMIPKEGEEAAGRKLFMMTDEMWENREYPPEVGSRTTSAEPSGRLAKEDDGQHARERSDGIRRRAARTRGARR